MPRSLQAAIHSATQRAIGYLQEVQRADGSFIPLWFGNEHAADENNPVYGTAQVLIALNSFGGADLPAIALMRSRAAQFLLGARRPSGGWGGDPHAPESVEETAVALEALSGCTEGTPMIPSTAARLLELIRSEPHPAPIGLYFARLWYFERLYPRIFALSALNQAQSQIR